MKKIGLLLTSIGSFVAALSLVLDKDNISAFKVRIGTALFLIGFFLYTRSLVAIMRLASRGMSN